MNQSFDEQKEIQIKIGVKLFSSSQNKQDLGQNKTKEGLLVLSTLNNGHDMRLFLHLASDQDNSENNEIMLSDWNSSKEGENESLMNNEWNHIEINFYQHKSFTLSVNNRSHREKVSFHMMGHEPTMIIKT